MSVIGQGFVDIGGKAEVFTVSEGDTITVAFDERGCPVLTFPGHKGQVDICYSTSILLVPVPS